MPRDEPRRTPDAEPPAVAGEDRSRPGALARPPRPVTLGVWVRTHPALTAAFLGFCLIAIAGLLYSVPRGAVPGGRSAHRAESRGAPAAPAGPDARTPGPRAPGARGETGAPGSPSAEAHAPATEPGPWTTTPSSPPSARGVALVHHYRTLPPGGESRFEWVVQLRGARTTLDGIEMVSWRMEPAAKNGADFVSRDRAEDGFPLFGHGPGGWFEVSATIRYRDGVEETLDRRIELPE